MGFFKSNRQLHADFSAIGTDLHSHVLPGMDDGSPSLSESIKMIKGLADAGYRRIITTPHVNAALYPNTKEQILGQLHHLRDVIADENIPVVLDASAEYHMDFEFMEKMNSGELIPFGERNYLLIELPFQSPSFSYNEILFQAQVLKYEPIIAHPERDAWLMGSMKACQGLRDRGMHFQLNINSLSGLYGLAPKLAAHKLIDAGMIDFVGSDAHHSYHVAELRKALSNKYFDKLLQGGRLLNSSI